MSLLKNGLQNRATRSTDLNNESSRSHTILQLSLEMEEQDDNGMMIVTRSTLNLVDLAGSEKWNATLAQAGNANISLQKEMMNINTSLHVLGNCISALIESGRKHIPYRDSVLTRLLQKTIGGNGKTILIATIREDTTYLEETYSTLQFANRASKIKVTINISRSFSDTTNINEANKQIKILKAKLDNLNNNNTITTNNSSTSNACQSCQGLQRMYDRMQRQIQYLKNENIELKEKLGIPHVKSSDNDDDNNNNNDYEKIEYLDENDNNNISGNYNDDSSLNYDSGSVWSKSSNNSNTRIDAYNKITIIKSRYHHHHYYYYYYHHHCTLYRAKSRTRRKTKSAHPLSKKKTSTISNNDSDNASNNSIRVKTSSNDSIKRKNSTGSFSSNNAINTSSIIANSRKKSAPSRTQTTTTNSDRLSAKSAKSNNSGNSNDSDTIVNNEKKKSKQSRTIEVSNKLLILIL